MDGESITDTAYRYVYAGGALWDYDTDSSIGESSDSEIEFRPGLDFSEDSSTFLPEDFSFSGGDEIPFLKLYEDKQLEIDKDIISEKKNDTIISNFLSPEPSVETTLNKNNNIHVELDHVLSSGVEINNLDTFVSESKTLIQIPDLDSFKKELDKSLMQLNKLNLGF